MTIKIKHSEKQVVFVLALNEAFFTKKIRKSRLSCLPTCG
jgi:hypothetical protein